MVQVRERDSLVGLSLCDLSPLMRRRTIKNKKLGRLDDSASWAAGPYIAYPLSPSLCDLVIHRTEVSARGGV